MEIMNKFNLSCLLLVFAASYRLLAVSADSAVGVWNSSPCSVPGPNQCCIRPYGRFKEPAIVENDADVIIAAYTGGIHANGKATDAFVPSFPIYVAYIHSEGSSETIQPLGSPTYSAYYDSVYGLHTALFNVQYPAELAPGELAVCIDPRGVTYNKQFTLGARIAAVTF